MIIALSVSGRLVRRPYRIVAIELCVDWTGRGGIYHVINGMTGKNFRGYFDKMRVVFYWADLGNEKRRIQQVSVGGMLGLGIGFNDGFDAGKNIQGRDCPAETAGKIFLVIGALGHSDDLLDGIFQIDPAVSVGIFGTELRKPRKKDQHNKSNA